MIEVTLDHTHQENYNIRTFWFKPPRTIRYTAGQFIEMYLPHDNPDERGIKHFFTLSSSPTEKLISISTKFAGAKSSTFKKTLFKLKPGAKIKLVEPMGDFVLPKDKTIPLVFVAGGIGITPFRSMVKWLSDTSEKRDIEALLAANAPKDFVFVDLFQRYGARVTQIVLEPADNWHGQTGKLSGDRIHQLIDKLQSKRIYVSGPEPLVEIVEKDLLEIGIAGSQLVLDFFPNYKSDLK